MKTFGISDERGSNKICESMDGLMSGFEEDRQVACEYSLA